MLKFKSKKGEVAALLTLGLVLIGSLITLGVSFLTNNNKIATNSRADESCTPTEGVNQSICFCKNNSVSIYASWSARVANCMTAPISNYINAQSYGTSNWAYCTSASDFPGGCSGGGPPGPGTLPTGCKSGTCKSNNFGNSDHPVSYYEDKPDKFYFEKNCGGTPVDRTSIMDTDHCSGAVQGDCTETPCGNFSTQLKKITGYDKDYIKSHTVFTKTGNAKYYDGLPCDDINETTLQEACIPPASETHTCTITVQCSDILGSKYTGELFQWSDEKGSTSYYKTNSCLAAADPDTDCIKVTPPPSASSFTCPGTETFTSGGATYTSCFKRDLRQTYNPGGVLGDYNDNFKPQCDRCGGIAGIGGNGDDGYCCNPTPQ
jgi:hypothetical protein